MKLSITSRLTLTTALLTLVVFAGSGIALYVILAAGIHADAARRAEETVQQHSYNATHQWEGLLDMGDEETLVKIIRLGAPHWALVRGSGQPLSARGIFDASDDLTSIGESRLCHHDGHTYRIASTPLFGAPTAGLDALPEHIQEAVRTASPEGQFLRAKLEVQRKGRVIIEVVLLEQDHLLELDLSYGGDVLERETRRLVAEVPPDLRATLGKSTDGDDLRFAAWRASNGQIIAVLEDTSDAGGEPRKIAVSRLGERFDLAADGRLLGPTPESRLWIVSAEDAADEIAATHRLLWAVLLGFPVLWILVILVGWYVTRQAMSPVGRIVDTLEAIEVSKLDERLPVRDVEDELDRISATINRMLDRIQSGYARERQFTADASHELRSPIAKVLADIDVALSKDRGPDEYRETLVRSKGYALGMRKLIESLLSLARLDAGGETANVRDFDLTDVAAEAVKEFPADQAARIRCDFSGADTVVTARGVPELVRILIHNLVDNALRYSPPESPVDLRLATSNGHVQVIVDDQGNGIPADQLDRVFSRFFRIDKMRSRETGGVGLGLAIAGEIARAHGARVSLENRATRGLRAWFTLPVSRA